MVFLIFLAAETKEQQRTRLIVWDVGQGLATTIVSNSSCLHMDAGGEKNPLYQIKKYCAKVPNYISISHFDFDHYSFLKSYLRGLRACMIKRPTRAKSIPLWLTKLKAANCQKEPIGQLSLKLIFAGTHNTKNKNNGSLVYQFGDKLVFPGDSEKAAEKLWTQKIKKKNWILIGGHHGSKTSNTAALTNKLGSSSLVVFSARKSIFGHPHASVVRNFKTKKIPTLQTENWGNIIIEL